MKRRRWLFPAVGGVVLLLLVVLACGEVKDYLKASYAARIPRTTAYPATPAPDLLCLTWSGDPATTQTVQWRTGPGTSAGEVEFRKEGAPVGEVRSVDAARTILTDPLIENDPVNHRYTATLTGLEPATAYTYRVGHRETNAWSDWHTFTMAPTTASPFSFVYLGDVQIGFEEWGGLVRRAHEQYPQAAFYVIPGDLANRGNNREEWDAFFAAGRGVFDERPLAPAIGNHECPREAEPWLYLSLLALPENGPEGIPPERTYSFTYGNSLFVVLDSNLSAKEQRPWLEDRLSTSQATWKFVVFHHPVYSSVAHRHNDEVHDYWADLFDRYKVDLVMQGHDHAYLRTYPMCGGKIVESPNDGVIYTITVSGSKYYEQGEHDYAAVAITDVSTYQIIDIQTTPEDSMTYRAYDSGGGLRDEFRKTKPRR